MINSLQLANFKCFEKLNLELSYLNVLAGINSMGKSTAIQALLLLRQAFDIGSLWNGLHLNGDLINIGTGYDLLYRNSEEDSFSISLSTAFDSYMWKYEYEKDSDFQKLIKTELNKRCEQMNIFAPSFTYVSANRLGPQKIYEKSYHRVVDRKQIGSKGELFVDFLHEFGNSFKVKNQNVLHESTKSQVLIYQLQAWLSEISPGVNINTKSYNEAGMVGISFSKDGYTPLNVGFGLSYIAPIIISILKASSGDLLILENPEAHLHPNGQRKMGELISAACSGGVQIIVETHSDHLLNGIRLSVKRKIINKEKVGLNYFYVDRKEDNTIIHRKCSPAILDNGSLSDWPDGFFDEWDKAIYELF